MTDENTNGTGNSDWHPGVGNISGIQLQVGVVGFHPKRVYSTVAAEAVVNVNELEVDAGPPLSATGGGGDRGPIIAGVATLAVAEVASSAG